MNLRSISVDIAPVCARDLRRKDAAATGFATVLCALAESIEEHWQPTIDDTDTESLHDLRVAVRRTRSVLKQAKQVVPDESRQHYADEFRWLAGLTGPTRDLDVLIAAWPDRVEGLDMGTIVALLPVVDHLRIHRQAAYVDLVAGLQSDRAAQLMVTWSHELTVIGPEQEGAGSRASRRLGAVVAKRLRATQRHLVTDGSAITSQSPASDLHELRKDAKQLRYIVECFGEILPTKPAKHFVHVLKELQDNLGAHQDAEVHGAQLRAVAAELGAESAAPTTMVALGRLIERVDAERREARTAFDRQFAEYRSKAGRRAFDAVVANLD